LVAVFIACQMPFKFGLPPIPAGLRTLLRALIELRPRDAP
jgi:hypothetical protein